MSVEMVPPSAPEAELREGSYVDWACVLAGAVVAAALSGLLMTFGSGVGLSLVSPFGGDSNFSMTTLVAITAAWTIIVYIGSYAAGGYLTGRMRRAWADASADEVMFRDGVHGLLVWAVGVILSAIVVALSANQAVSTAGAALGNTGAAATMDYAIDSLLRSQPNTQTGGQQQQADANRAETRAEMRRLLTSIGTQSLAPQTTAQGAGQGGGQQGAQGAAQDGSDRAYLVQLVQTRTGLSAADAEQRVNQVITRARNATEQARRVGIIAAFLTGAVLLVAAVMAWYAAAAGGRDRERGIGLPAFARTRPRTSTT